MVDSSDSENVTRYLCTLCTVLCHTANETVRNGGDVIQVIDRRSQQKAVRVGDLMVSAVKV